jgi:acyl carrier protein phosphodiesterase
MNFLAHLLLSGDRGDIIAGNFAGDFVKGRLTAEKVRDWSADYLLGVRLHRFIDQMTDHHPIVRETKRTVAEQHGRLSGIILDIYFDYILAHDFERFCDENLEKYAVKIYGVVQNRVNQLPPQILPMMSAMIRQDWLMAYQTLDGIELTFARLSRRAAFLAPISTAGTLLKEKEFYFRTQFDLFFPDLQAACAHFIASSGEEMFLN